jgi:hypothetical protein
LLLEERKKEKQKERKIDKEWGRVGGRRGVRFCPYRDNCCFAFAALTETHKRDKKLN